jgi:PrpF protein
MPPPACPTARYFTPHRCHTSHAVTGAIGIATAFALPGTVTKPFWWAYHHAFITAAAVGPSWGLGDGERRGQVFGQAGLHRMLLVVRRHVAVADHGFCTRYSRSAVASQLRPCPVSRSYHCRPMSQLLHSGRIPNLQTTGEGCPSHSLELEIQSALLGLRRRRD